MRICVCGIPGSGKTTFSVKLHDFLISSCNVELVSFDDIEKSFQVSNSFEPDAWKKARNFVLERLFHQSDNLSVYILDDTFHLKSMRKQMRPHLIIHLDTPIDKCIENNKFRNRNIPEDVIIKMFNIFEIPPVSNTWESKIPCIRINGFENYRIDDIIQSQQWLIAKESSMKLSPVPSEKEVSLKEQLDLEMRKVVNNVLKMIPEENKAYAAKQLSDEKRRALKEFVDDGLLTEYLVKFRSFAHSVPGNL